MIFKALDKMSTYYDMDSYKYNYQCSYYWDVIGNVIMNIIGLALLIAPIILSIMGYSLPLMRADLDDGIAIFTIVNTIYSIWYL